MVLLWNIFKPKFSFNCSKLNLKVNPVVCFIFYKMLYFIPDCGMHRGIFTNLQSGNLQKVLNQPAESSRGDQFSTCEIHVFMAGPVSSFKTYYLFEGFRCTSVVILVCELNQLYIIILFKHITKVHLWFKHITKVHLWLFNSYSVTILII